MSRQTAPNHSDPDAFAGLRRRLALRAQSAIDSQAPADAADTVAAYYRWHHATPLGCREDARKAAAATAGIPLLERIGRAPAR